MRALILILIAAPALADGPVPRQGQTIAPPKAVECYCTDKTRQRLELGQTTCLQVGGQTFLAQCQMSLNVPMWRRISDGCPTSSLPQSVQPAG